MTYFEQTESGKEYRSDDGNATEEEVREFIKGLCAIMKPDVVLETGCYRGGLTKIIAEAIPRRSVLFTCDTDNKMVELTSLSLRDIDEFGNFVIHQSTGIALIEFVAATKEIVDLGILDSSGDRIEEAQALSKIMRPGGIVLIHDTKRQMECTAAITLAVAGYMRIVFDTPRGLTMLQAPGC